MAQVALRHEWLASSAADAGTTLSGAATSPSHTHLPPGKRTEPPRRTDADVRPHSLQLIRNEEELLAANAQLEEGSGQPDVAARRFRESSRRKHRRRAGEHHRREVDGRRLWSNDAGAADGMGGARRHRPPAHQPHRADDEGTGERADAGRPPSHLASAFWRPGPRHGGQRSMAWQRQQRQLSRTSCGARVLRVALDPRL